MYVFDTASAAYVHDKTLVRCNGATPILLFSGVTFMIGVAWATRYVRRAGSWQLPSALPERLRLGPPRCKVPCVTPFRGKLTQGPAVMIGRPPPARCA